MPQMRGFLNAIGRRLARFGRADPGERRLAPAAFLAHAAALAAREPVPPGLWLSLLGEGAGEASPVCEHVRLDPGLADPAARWADAVARARAPFVARWEGPGRFTAFAAPRIAAALAAAPGAWALYTDEAYSDARGRAREIVLKPAFDPVLLESFDYFGRLAVYSRERLLALGGWRLEGGAGDHDLALRFAAAAPPGAILHLPFPAVLGPEPASPPHARAGRGGGFATGLAPDRLRPVLRPEPRDWPKVAVIVPSRDAPDLIGTLLEGLARTDYPDFEIVVVDNGTTDPRTLALYQRHRVDARFRAEIEPAPFNFSRAVNRGARLTDAPLLLPLNNDIEVLDPGWLKEMVDCLEYPGAGIVGAKLVYPDGTLQHAGVIAGLGGYAGHWHVGRPGDDFGPQRRLAARQSFSVVTGACMLVTRGCFEAAGGFDEAAFAVAYNDVDFCLRAGALGFRVIWTPFAKLVHRESVSRGSDERPENRARFALEKAALAARHATATIEDRAYNPWALRGHSDPWPTARATLPPARA